jgi:hypothetical protein
MINEGRAVDEMRFGVGNPKRRKRPVLVHRAGQSECRTFSHSPNVILSHTVRMAYVPTQSKCRTFAHTLHTAVTDN